MRALLLLSFVAVAYCSPFSFLKDKLVTLKEKIISKATYSYAADISDKLSLATFNCLQLAGYSTVFIRTYKSDDSTQNGAIDTNVLLNIQNAEAANLGIEVYATPGVIGLMGKTGATELEEIYSYLVGNGIDLEAIWLQVSHPLKWKTDVGSNINFINSFVTRAKQQNLRVGIYTNWYDWQEITNNWTGLASDVSLWYWNANGIGTNAASTINFLDFRAFGAWTSSAVKQYAQQASVCSTYVNQNIYPVGTKAAVAVADKPKDGKITVGKLIF